MIAVESVGMLDLGSSCLSFEEILRMAGLLMMIPHLLPHLTKKAHDQHLEKGKIRRTTGECFKNPPLL